MQCVHSLEANRYAYVTGLADKLAEQKQVYINREAEKIISNGYSDEYKDVISLMIDHLDRDLLTKYDALNQQIINTNDIDKLVILKNELRALIKSVACDYVEERMNRLGDRWWQI